MYNLDINQSETFSSTVYATGAAGLPFNLSGYSLYSNIFNRYGDTGVLGVFDTNIVNSGSGIFTLSLTSINSSSLPVTQGVYNVFASGIDMVKLREGYVNIFSKGVL